MPGDAIRIRRFTPANGLVATVYEGSILSARDLNINWLQFLYLRQEDLDARAIAGDGLLIDERLDTLETALSTEELNRILAISEVEAALADTQGALTATEASLRNTLLSLTSDLGETDAALLSERNARIAADEAFASSVSAALARLGDAEAAIITETQARVTADEALTQQATLLDSRLDSAESGLSSQASSLSSLTSRVTTAEGQITSQSSAITGLSSRIDGVEGTNTAQANAISSLTTRVTNAEGVNSSQATALTNLSTTVGSNTASISTLATSVDGIRAQYVLNVDVNGRVAGIKLLNDGTTSSFDILVDKFRIINPSGGGAVVPFNVEGGQVYITDAFIKNLTVDKLSAGNLNSDFGFGTGRIVLETATHMKVIGAGFGVGNEFIEWFGPKKAISLCDKPSAISYVTKDGDSYFGGALSAGVLYNAAQSTTKIRLPEVTVGPFGTAGSPRTYVCSFSFGANGTSATPVGSGGASITFVLYRKIGTAAEVEVGRQTVTTVMNSSFEEGSYFWVESATGSFTVTDSNTSTLDHTLRAVVITNGRFASDAQVQNQRLSVISTELGGGSSGGGGGGSFDVAANYTTTGLWKFDAAEVAVRNATSGESKYELYSNNKLARIFYRATDFNFGFYLENSTGIATRLRFNGTNWDVQNAGFLVSGVSVATVGANTFNENQTLALGKMLNLRPNAVGTEPGAADLPTSAILNLASNYHNNSLVGVSAANGLWFTHDTNFRWFYKSGASVTLNAELFTTGVLWTRAGFKSDALAGSGTRMVVADSTGLLSTQAIPGGGGGSGVTWLRQAANVSNSTPGTGSNTDLQFSAAASKRYMLKGYCRYTSAAATTGIQPVITGPAGTTVYGKFSKRTATAIGTDSETVAAVTAISSPVLFPAALTADGWLEFWVIVETSTTPGTVGLRFQSEIASSAVQILAGSVMSYELLP